MSPACHQQCRRHRRWSCRQRCLRWRIRVTCFNLKCFSSTCEILYISIRIQPSLALGAHSAPPAFSMADFCFFGRIAPSIDSHCTIVLLFGSINQLAPTLLRTHDDFNSRTIVLESCHLFCAHHQIVVYMQKELRSRSRYSDFNSVQKICAGKTQGYTHVPARQYNVILLQLDRTRYLPLSCYIRNALQAKLNGHEK